MSHNARRPRRLTKKNSEFNTGDLVLVTRGDKPSERARLAQLLTTGTSPNPRWLVQYENGSNQEVYESTFTLLESSGNGTATNSSRSNSPRSDPETAFPSETTPSELAVGATGVAGSAGATATTPLSAPDTNRDKDSSSPVASETESAKASAREARSRRRQLLIDDTVVAQHPVKRNKKNTDEQVKKIKMLTGTLYLYRGAYHRRAEFVRRV